MLSSKVERLIVKEICLSAEDGTKMEADDGTIRRLIIRTSLCLDGPLPKLIWLLEDSHIGWTR